MLSVYNWVTCNLVSKDFSIKKSPVADKKQGVHNSGNIKSIFVKSYIINNMFSLRLTNINLTYPLRSFHRSKITD
jgi:hypothetical protein